MNHFIYQDKIFNLIDRQWDYDTNTVTCHIEKGVIPFSTIEELFPVDETISEFTLEYEESGSETPFDYTVINCQEEEEYYELIFQYRPFITPEIKQLVANLDYLATMLDIDLSE